MSQARSVSWSSTTSRRGQYLLLSSGTRAGSPQLPPRYRARALLAARAAMRGRCFRSQLRLSPMRAHGVRSRASPIAGAAQRLKNECASSSRSALQARLCRLPPPDAADRDRDYAKRTVKKASARPCATPLRLSFARVCQPPAACDKTPSVQIAPDYYVCCPRGVLLSRAPLRDARADHRRLTGCGEYG